MKNKLLIAILVLVIIIISISFFNINNSKIDELNKDIACLNGVIEELRIKKEPTKESIFARLENCKLANMNTSHSSKFITFFLFDPSNETDKCKEAVYLYDAEKQSLVNLNVCDACEVLFSPNEESLIVDVGTSMLREGIIFSTKDVKRKGIIGYCGDVFWVDNDNVLYVSEDQSVMLNADLEVTYGEVVVKQNIVNGEKQVLLEAGMDYVYKIAKIQGKRALIEKIYINTDGEREKIWIDI